MSFLRTLLFLFFLFGAGHLFSQDLIINYTEPSDLIVCDSNDFVFTLTNASPDTLFNVGVTVNTPPGLEYVAGSITNGIELDISIPNAPLFSYPMILPFEGIEFTISTELKCALVTSINSGALFTNTISAEWDGGNNSATTLPYIIETPLLVITDVTNTLTAATQGETITRTITIQNTRLGALPSFTFTDNHLGGIEISSALGTVISSTGNSFVLELSGDDFMTIGDGDNLFEQDEIIVITEFVEILDCGLLVPFTNSAYSVTWGCYNQTCQEATQSAVIDIIPSAENPELIFDAFSILPTDFCAGSLAQQGITITNVGTFAAEDLELRINLGSQNTSTVVAGFDPSTFVEDSNGIISTPTPAVSIPAVSTDCTFPSGIFEQAELVWASLPPGESITLTWDYYYYCGGPDQCGRIEPPLDYTYSYLNHCPADSTITGNGGPSLESFLLNQKQILYDSAFYFFGEPVIDPGTYTANYALRSTKLLNPGLLNIEFTLPCGLTWGNSDLMMGGQLPTNIDVTPMGDETNISVTYNLPMDSSFVVTSFDLDFACDPNCGSDFGSCVIPYITASGDVGCGTETTINIVTSLQEDPSISFECGMQACRTITLMVDCDLNDLPIPGLGLFIFSHDFERCNYDLPDNDDDRQPDATGALNFDQVRTDRAIPGDTITNILSAIFDFPTGSIPGADVPLMTVQFEAHTMDNGIDGGTVLNFGLNGGLMTNGGITPVSAIIRIVNMSAGTSFKCEIGDPSLVFNSLYHRFTMVNTEPISPVDEVLYNQFKYNTSLANIPCLPPGFEYENGDSIIFTTKHRMVYNPKPQVIDSYIPPIVNMRSAIIPIQCDLFNI
jgi:hypothetical protein